MSEAGPKLDGSRLLELLEQQRSLYRRMRALTERQRSLVVRDDTQPLLKLLADRQKLVDELVKLNEDMAGFRRDWTNIYNSLDEASRERVSELLEEANSSLGAILQSDSKDSETLSARKQSVGDRLLGSAAAGRASAAYAASNASGNQGITDSQA